MAMTLTGDAVTVIAGFFIGFFSFLLWQLLPKVSMLTAVGLGAGVATSFLITL